MVRQYVGARYVPKFADPVAWTRGTSYEAMTIVTYNNSSYTSKIPVPATVGDPADNPDYWALTGNYNAQVEQYRQETETVSNNLTTEITNLKNADTALQGQITTTENNLNTEITIRKNADTTLQDQITTEITNRETVDATLQHNIDAESTERQTANNILQGNISSEAATRASADSNLQSQINQIVAPSGEAPSAAEVQNARIGADGVTYDTLGTAIRSQVNNLNNDLGDYANSGLISIAEVNTLQLQNNELNSFTVNLKANTMYLLDTVFNGSGQYSVSFYDSNNTLIDRILNLSITSDKRIFYLKKDATKMNVFRSSPTDGLNLNVYSYDTALYNLQSTVASVTLKDYAKQYADIVDYIVDIAKGDLVTITITTDRQANTTVRLYNTDTYSATEETNLTLWDTISQLSKSYTFVADKDYKFLHVYKSIGILTLKVDKEKSHKDKQVKLNFVNGSYYPNGGFTTEYTNRVAPQTLGGNGLFLVTFPDTMICRYYADNASIDTETPFSIYGKHDLYVSFKSKDENKPISTDSDLSGIKIWYIDKPHDNDDIIVSASDSKDAYKQISDIVCDGTNDTDILSALVGSFDSINIKLMDGTYNINKAWKTSNNAKVSLSLNEYLLGYNGSTRRRYITMRGNHKTTPQDFEGVKLVVSEALHNSFDNSTNNIILGAGYDISKEIVRIACSVDFENFNIIGFKYDKPITYVDTTRCLSTMIDSVNIRSWKDNLLEYKPFENTPNEECCGMRVGRGSNYGIQNYVKHSNIWYCGKGLACNGEHFIFEDVKLHHDYNAIVLGDRKTVGRFEHPNIFIGCSIEACYRLGILSKNGITEPQDFIADSVNRLLSSTLVMIGTSTETTWFIPTNEIVDNKTTQPTLPFTEILRGCYRGRIEMDWYSSPFADDGSGKRMNYTSYNDTLNTYRNDVK